MKKTIKLGTWGWENNNNIGRAKETHTVLEVTPSPPEIVSVLYEACGNTPCEFCRLGAMQGDVPKNYGASPDTKAQ